MKTDKLKNILDKSELNHNLAGVVMKEYEKINSDGFNYLENILDLDCFSDDELKEVIIRLYSIIDWECEYSFKFKRVIYRYEDIEDERRDILEKNNNRDGMIYKLNNFDIRNLMIKSDRDIVIFEGSLFCYGSCERSYSMDAGLYSYNDVIKWFYTESDIYSTDWFIDEVKNVVDIGEYPFFCSKNCIAISFDTHG